MKVAYFVHNIDDAAVLKRMELLRLGQVDIRLIGFKRFSQTRAAPANDDTIVLGRTYDGKFALRILSVIRSLVFPIKIVSAVKGADSILCRNLEMLALGYATLRLSGKKIPLNYECLDIHKKLLGSGRAAKMLRSVERYLMARCNSVITSSPGFVRNYFVAVQHFDGRVCLIENKVLPQSAPNTVPAKLSEPPWVIGWFGIIRCRKSLVILQKLTAALPMVRVVIAGRVAAQEISDFLELVEASPSISFIGSYEPSELARIYGQAHFVWAIDYYEEGDNSTWLLPNRLYDSLAFGCVPIALGDVETGRWLKARSAGVVVMSPLDELIPTLSAMSESTYRELKGYTEGVERGDVFHSDLSVKQLVGAVA